MGDSIFGDYQLVAAIQWPQPATNLKDLSDAVTLLHGGSVLTLRQALVHLQLMDEETLDALHLERPDLLRNRSSELVNRFHVAADDLNHAMSRMAGLAEVDAERFDLAPDAFDVVSLQVARSHDVMPLGRIGDLFYVASFFPTNEGLQNYLCFLTGRRVHLVWASRTSIESRLVREAGSASHRVTPPPTNWTPRPTWPSVFLPARRASRTNKTCCCPGCVATSCPSSGTRHASLAWPSPISAC